MRNDPTFRGCVGPGLEPDEATRRHVRKIQRAAPVGTSETILLVCLTGLALAVYALLEFSLARIGMPYRLAHPLSYGVACGSAIWGSQIVCRRHRSRRARQYLRTRGYAVCEGCGYVMAGLPGDASCPECAHVSTTPVRATTPPKYDPTFGGHVGPGLELDDATHEDLRRRFARWRDSPELVRRQRAAVILWSAGLAVACAIASRLLFLFLKQLDFSPFLATCVTLAAVCTGVGFTAWSALYRMQNQRLRHILRTRGYAVCERCGHVMTGLPDHAPCPECSYESRTPVGTASIP
ncbi:MAG: hypothetical protein KDA21_00665 [Phycisphaerales bacterium]|nr:hypothetical protein [Phycisphaerales bacterium]